MKFFPLGKRYETETPAWYQGMMEDLGMGSSGFPTWVLTPEGDMTGPLAIALDMPPGYKLFRHGHPCYRFEIVTRGTLELGDGQVANAGDCFTALPGELYGPHTAGPEGCTTIEVFSQADGMFRMLHEGPDGEVIESDARKGEVPDEYEPLYVD